jgi:hypothetical protein
VSYEEYNQLQSNISNVLDEAVNALPPLGEAGRGLVQSSKLVQKKNGLLKPKPAKELTAAVQ